MTRKLTVLSALILTLLSLVGCFHAEKYAATDLSRRIEACTCDIESGKISGKELSLAFSARGYFYGEIGDYDRAIADYTRAIELDPTNADTYYNRGNSYMSKDDYDPAIADYSRVIAMKPGSCVYNNRGGAYRLKGEFAKAVADLSKAIELDPKLALAYFNRGDSYSGLQRWDEAITDYTKALEPPRASSPSSIAAMLMIKSACSTGLSPTTPAPSNSTRMPPLPGTTAAMPGE